ncbi:MAG: hypothetical protein ACHQ0Y_04710 [Thermodesulfovibrionales bacterium]
MIARVFAGIIFIVLGVAATAGADLDLDKEVLVIPDTHNEKPYIWNVVRNPRGYELVMEYGGPATGLNDQFSFEVKRESSAKMDDMQVFITDEDLHTFAHVRPVISGAGKYSFNFAAPDAGKYRFEMVFRTDASWVNLRQDIRLKKAAGKVEPALKPGDEDYDVKVKLYPKKIYADHVGTFLYEISYKGKPLKDIEKIDGSDMQVAAWDEDLKEFIHMTPKQNLGGPDVAVSVVFTRPGKHAVFAEFRHNGITRRVDFVVNVYREPSQDKGSLPYLGPSE